MAPTDRKHEKKLREAEKAYNKWKKAFLAGRISKDELKDRLRPYKYELHELNLVKLKEGDLPPTEGDKGSSSDKTEKKIIDIKRPVSYPPWKKASSLTVEEIEERVDLLSLGSKPSETLQMLYEKRYGEDLSPPQELVSFHIDDEDDEMEELPTRRYSELPAVEDTLEAPEQEEEDQDDEGTKKKGFWKGLLKRKKGEA